MIYSSRDLAFPRWKRIFDLFLLVATAFVWLPLMILIMCGIRIVSPGPVFFRQRRVGLRGKPFMIYKFRSMKLNAETQSHEQYLEQLMRRETPMTKLDAADERLIPLGHLFRASGLDELPQIFNVLRGEMSLVGPRPCTEVECARYQSWQKQRFDAPPGMTGYWQVHGKNNTTFNQMIAMDILYSQRMSLGMDLAIILRTPAVLLGEIIESFSARWRGRQQAIEIQPIGNTVPAGAASNSKYE
jgi:lipopolysaccharide/colanic/teichoic acid biosynthesis glycosyltransferase